MTCADEIEGPEQEGADSAAAEAADCLCGRGCPPYAPGPEAVESRASNGPVMAGDVLRGERVVGFSYAQPPDGRLPEARDDRLLTEADHQPDAPPQRPVPTVRPPGPGDERLPHDRLPTRAVVPAARRSRCLPAAVDNLLADGSAPWGRVFDPIARTVREAGHELWLSGGAPRELVAGNGREAVRDLDLTGTAPAGRFAELARRTLEEDGETYELRARVSPDTLVCTVYRDGGPTPLIEYRGLGLGGFRFPATGTDLVADSLQRDFTVNCVLYDFERHLVLDPSERGLPHLSAPGRALVPVSASGDPLVRAALAVRAVKFLVRWQTDGPVDTRELRAWTDEFPEDLADHVRERGDQAWDRLLALHHECLGGVPAQRQTAVASTLGAGVERLLKTLLGSAE
ncbi:hypothetical protein ACFC4C_38475 [Streptomyces sp. NPDC056039]|uniref:hypothetical protein n=1 Tax=Streptomyces sp. NPDC056039 TaxID=3345687 RepID=UPI0035D638DF